jgi:hypothetical protein
LVNDQAVRHALPAGVWSADKIHSTVRFAVPYMAGTFQGTFSEFDARLRDGALREARKAVAEALQALGADLLAHLDYEERNLEATILRLREVSGPPLVQQRSLDP